MNSDMMDALYTIEREKGSRSRSCWRRGERARHRLQAHAGSRGEALVEIDIETGDIHVIAQELDEEGQVVKEWDDTPKDFGRIAAQTAKQVILQRIREAEREMKYEEYAGREGDIVTGIIQQTDQRYTLLDLGKVEALLPQAEQSRTSATTTAAASRPTSSRSARPPRARRSSCPGPTPVWSSGSSSSRCRSCSTACGAARRRSRAGSPYEDRSGFQRRQRRPGRRLRRCTRRAVRQVVTELRGEKVDIVPYTDDAADFVMKALAPARVREVRVHPDTGTAE